MLCFLFSSLIPSPQKIVFTGGPGVGKTTVLNELAKHGYRVVHETATYIIDEAASLHMQPPYLVPAQFQEDIYKLQMAWETNLHDDEATVAFLDRSLIDSFAYYELNNVQVPEELINAAGCLKCKAYEKVFIFNFLDTYVHDALRWEDIDTAQRIEALLRKYYDLFGYELIDVPAMSVDDRVKFILSHI
jgi:predicted ATPase